jgi:hypothetical protein
MELPKMTRRAQGKIDLTLLETMNRVSERQTLDLKPAFKLKKYDQLRT